MRSPNSSEHRELPALVAVTEVEQFLLEMREAARREGDIAKEITNLSMLGEYYLERHLPGHAISIGEQLSYIKCPPEDRKSRAGAFELMGRGLRLQGSTQEAFYHFNYALTILDAELGDLLQFVSIQRQMCQILEAQGDYDLAALLYKNQLDMLRKNVPIHELRDKKYIYMNGDPSSDYRECLIGLSNIHMTIGQSAEAVPYLREAAALADVDGPKDSVSIRVNLAAALLGAYRESSGHNRSTWSEGIAMLKDIATAAMLRVISAYTRSSSSQ